MLTFSDKRVIYIMNDIMVSISCLTYNHEDYIEEAIESFLAQKTTFKYEILIHDDASTDRTTQIIKKYEKKYPGLIKPIYQTENQYSKKVKVPEFNRKRAQGRYIAICEGDDYWIDPYKLQKQIEYMEKNSNCSACVHAAIKIDAETKRIVGEIRPGKKSRYYSIEEIIVGGGALFATNSIVYRNSFKQLPEFYYKAPVGDYPLMIYLAIIGDVYYIDDYMSVYRIGIDNSWTKRNLENSIEKRINHFEEVEIMLNKISEYTNYKYKDTIQRKIAIDKINQLILIKDLKDIKTQPLKEYYNSLNLVDKLKIYCKKFFPVLKTVNRVFNMYKPYFNRKLYTKLKNMNIKKDRSEKE